MFLVQEVAELQVELKLFNVSSASCSLLPASASTDCLCTSDEKHLGFIADAGKVSPLVGAIDLSLRPRPHSLVVELVAVLIERLPGAASFVPTCKQTV